MSVRFRRQSLLLLRFQRFLRLMTCYVVGSNVTMMFAMVWVDVNDRDGGEHTYLRECMILDLESSATEFIVIF